MGMGLDEFGRVGFEVGRVVTWVFGCGGGWVVEREWWLTRISVVLCGFVDTFGSTTTIIPSSHDSFSSIFSSSYSRIADVRLIFLCYITV